MKPVSVWHVSRPSLFGIDYLLAWVAVVCAFKFSPRIQEDIFSDFVLSPELRLTGYILPLFVAVGLNLAGVQERRSGVRWLETTTRAFIGVIAGMVVFLVVHAFIRYELVGRYVLGFTAILTPVLVTASRGIVWRFSEQRKRTLLVYGSDATGRALASEVAAARIPIQVAGAVSWGRRSDGETGQVVLDDSCTLYGYAMDQGVSEIVIEAPSILSSAERKQLIDCTGRGLRVMDLGLFYEREFERVFVAGLQDAWFWSYDPAFVHPLFFSFKRAADVVLSLLGLLCFLPIAPFVFLLVKLQDGGPVIYSQVRLGQHNRKFEIYKIRSMRIDAERSGPQWARRTDARVTWFGGLLRKTRLDEVPQFWNILKGDMSFIGPRPERPEMTDGIESVVPYFRYRHLIKPGLTGWAQINYPYAASIEDAKCKLAFDLYYIKHASMALEIHIALRTIVAMVRGAR